MHCMVASSIPCKLSLCADRAHARAGDSHASSAIDVACPTTQKVLAIASPHELHGDSWPSSSTGTRSFCCNQQYSVTAITTSAGAISERYAYTAYGQPTILNASGTVISATTLSNRYTYTGREWDATLGLHHFRARWMSPSAGRFLGRDPIGYDISSLLYDASFMVVGLDPSGESPCSENPLSTGVPCSAAEARQAVGRCARECAANGYTYRGEGLICCTKGVGRGVIKACECRTSKNCTTSMLFPLHKKMHSFCDKPGCAGLDPSKESDCKQIRPRIADLGRCIFYREKIQDCFTPGEPDWDGHIIQILGKKAAKNNCEIKHKICCMKIK
jgi:RHS repeat-associated protein